MKHEPSYLNVCHDLIPLFLLRVRHGIRGVTSQTERTWEDKAFSANSCSNYTKTFFYSESRCLPPRQRAEDLVITGGGKHTCSHTLFSGSSDFLSKFCQEHATQLRVKAELQSGEHTSKRKIPESFERRLKFSCFLGFASHLGAKLFQNSACTQTRQNTHRESVHTCITQLSVNSGGFVWLPEWAITQALFKRGWSDFFFSFLKEHRNQTGTECLDNKHKTHGIWRAANCLLETLPDTDTSSICSLIPDDKSQFPEIHTICLSDLCVSCCFAPLFQNQSTV